MGVNYPVMNSRTRKVEYVSLFGELDELRVILLKQIKNLTIENIDQDESAEAEAKIDVLVGKLDFVNEVAAVIINAYIENETLDGN